MSSAESSAERWDDDRAAGPPRTAEGGRASLPGPGGRGGGPRPAVADHTWRAPSDPAAVPDATAASPAPGAADAAAEGGEPESGADWAVAGEPVAREPVADEALLAGRTQEYRDRWHRVQLAFVDDPRRAVEEADHLVDDVIASIVDTLAGQRARLEAGWQQGTEATTEELRLALRRYRAFLNRLLAAG